MTETNHDFQALAQANICQESLIKANEKVSKGKSAIQIKQFDSSTESS
jgi:hypothetical protein